MNGESPFLQLWAYPCAEGLETQADEHLVQAVMVTLVERIWHINRSDRNVIPILGLSPPGFENVSNHMHSRDSGHSDIPTTWLPCRGQHVLQPTKNDVLHRFGDIVVVAESAACRARGR